MVLLTEMYVKGMRPAGFAVAATIRACSAAGEWTKGLEVLRQSQQVEPPKPDPCSLGAAIEMCCRAGELVSAFLLNLLVRGTCTKNQEIPSEERPAGVSMEVNY